MIKTLKDRPSRTNPYTAEVAEPVTIQSGRRAFLQKWKGIAEV